MNADLNGAAPKDAAAPEGKVSIKDRIACYKWTFFTMVCPQHGSQTSLCLSTLTL